ncbi:hypothetical protein ABID58_003406 [Bradyrhizobium sp. S3.2.6]
MNHYAGIDVSLECSSVCGQSVRGALGGVFRRSRDVAASCEEAGNGDILVQRLPVQSNPAEFDLLAFGRRCMQQARKPRERNTQCPTIGQFDPHGGVIEAYVGGRSGHAVPLQADRGSGGWLEEYPNVARN